MHRLTLPLLSAGAALFAASSALATEVTVEEFGAMTRVTIPVTSESGWVIERSSTSLSLRTDTAEGEVSAPELDEDGQIATLDVSQDDDKVVIDMEFSCDCQSNHFYGEGGIVVIDITERQDGDVDQLAATTPVDIEEGWASAQVEVQEPRPIYVPTILPPVAAPVAPPVAPAPPLMVPAASPPIRYATAPVEDDPVPTPPARSRAAPAPASASAAEIWRLANVLVGTPLPRRKPAVPTPARVLESDDAAIDALREAVLETLAVGVEQGRITMDSGTDHSRTAYVPAGCPDEGALDLKRLTNTSDFREALPPLRVDVYDEMKQVNQAAVRSLARHFIAFGLGEEARNVIAAFETKEIPERLILDMATVLEGDGGTLSESALMKADCGPRAAVWGATVAAEQSDGTVTARFETAREAIYDVPGPLRKILGARIALGLIDEGDSESAMRLWRNLKTANGPRTPEMRLLAAYAAEGDTIAPLLALAETRSPAAIEAATRAAALLQETNARPLAERLGTALEDLAFIHRDTDRETPLDLALARLQARYGDLAAALTVLAEKAEENPDRAEYWRSIAHDTIRDATEGADPIARPHDFDTILASLQYLDNSQRSDAAKYALSRKLMSVGGAHVVESILTPTILARSDEARRLLAEAKLLMGDANGARRLLRDLRDEDSIALTERTEQITAAGSADAARALFDPVTRVPEQASISTARELMDEADTDMTIIEELLADG